MLGYYLELALRSLKRNPVLTALMVLAIGLGIGASMTMLTVLHVMSGNPVPRVSAHLYVPMLDPREPTDSGAHAGIEKMPGGLTWTDAMELLHARRAARQAAMTAGGAVLRPDDADVHPFFAQGQYVTADFFTMFGVPFRAGRGWTQAQDTARARVVVLNTALAHKLFGDGNAIGQTVNLDNSDFRVVGVVDHWHPQPKFYGPHTGRVFGLADQLFLPLQTAMELKLAFSGDLHCWGNRGDDRQSDHCIWLNFWVELDDPVKVRSYRQFLTGYWHEQQAHGRFPRKHALPHLYGLMPWLAHEKVIPANLSMQAWLAIGFLIVCMLSVVALLLAKFLRRSGEISVRRAMGARKRDIFVQFGVEAALIGVAGGLLGLLFAQIGLWSVRLRAEGYAQLAQMDVTMLMATIVLAIVASTLAGLLPAWRACHVPPALQLKTL